MTIEAETSERRSALGHLTDDKRERLEALRRWVSPLLDAFREADEYLAREAAGEETSTLD